LRVIKGRPFTLGKWCMLKQGFDGKVLTDFGRHYVAFIRKEISNEGESWVLFNDEKVVKAEGDVDAMKKFAYVYFFERV